LINEGKIIDLYKKNGDFNRFSNRYEALMYLKDFNNVSLETKLRPSIKECGSKPFEKLGEPNLRHLFDLKLRDAKASL